MSLPRMVIAPNRRIGVRALELLQARDWQPVGVIAPNPGRASHFDRFVGLLPEGVPVFDLGSLRERSDGLAALEADYLVSIHYPNLLPGPVLETARVGALNLHPSLLPYNRGWHTPSWAILDGTPAGATLHWMTEGVDDGDIAMQTEVPIHPSDTAHTLYQRILDAEVAIWVEALAVLASGGELPRRPQNHSHSTRHDRADLAAVQRIDRSADPAADRLIDLLRALTTNQQDEAAYFEEGGRRYRLRIAIEPVDEEPR